MSDIHIHITVDRPLSAFEVELQRREAQALGFAAFQKALESMWNEKISREQAKGNPNWAHVETLEQYQAAWKADERDKRKRLGFWRYHFGSE
jgi:hypothetical protein